MHPTFPLPLRHLPTPSRTRRRAAGILANLINGPRNARLQSATSRLFSLVIFHTFHTVFATLDRYTVGSPDPVGIASRRSVLCSKQRDSELRYGWQYASPHVEAWAKLP